MSRYFGYVYSRFIRTGCFFCSLLLHMDSSHLPPRLAQYYCYVFKATSLIEGFVSMLMKFMWCPCQWSSLQAWWAHWIQLSCFPKVHWWECKGKNFEGVQNKGVWHPPCKSQPSGASTHQRKTSCILHSGRHCVCCHLCSLSPLRGWYDIDVFSHVFLHEQLLWIDHFVNSFRF